MRGQFSHLMVCNLDVLVQIQLRGKKLVCKITCNKKEKTLKIYSQSYKVQQQNNKFIYMLFEWLASSFVRNIMISFVDNNL